MAKKYQGGREVQAVETVEAIMPMPEMKVEEVASIEAAQPIEFQPPQIPTVILDFDAWWVMTQKHIPAHHHKEIIKVDFQARGLSLNESMQSYNEALGKYGIKLN